MLKLMGKLKCLFGFHDSMYIMYTGSETEVCARCGKIIAGKIE